MNEQRFRFPCGTILLEGVLFEPTPGRPAPGAVVCHPHPLYGGSQDNAVVLAVSRALAARGFAVLRFNFRGVGASGGAHGGGETEVDDVVAAVDFLSGREGVDVRRLSLVGYSFGAAVALEAGCRDPRVRALALVAPPLAAFPMSSARHCSLPKLTVAGTRDAYCPGELLDSWFEAAAEPKGRSAIRGADHFFSGREDEAGETVAVFLAGTLGLHGTPG